jgi:hypothetical protein
MWLPLGLPHPTATATAATGAGHHPKMRLYDPKPFDGSPKNTDSFINSCVNIFMAQPDLYADAESQVQFALSFFKLKAIRWRDALFHDLKNGDYIITTWTDFKDHLRESFGNPHLVDEAQCNICMIVQGSWMAEDFFIAFEDLKAECGFDNMSVIFQLK